MQLTFAVGRVLLVLIFVLSGGMKLLDIEGTAAQIGPVIPIPEFLANPIAQLETATNMKWPQLLAVLTGIVEVVAGLLVAFNVGTRGAAAVLVLFTLVTTYHFHPFWTMTGADMQNNMIHALKNLSIVGGLLTFVVLGQWRPISSSQA